MNDLQKIEEVTQTIMGGNQSLIQQALTIVVDSDAALSFASDILGEIKMRLKHVEKERTDIVKPINDSVKNINAKFKTVSQPLEDAESALKPKVLKFQAEVERIKREAAEAERKRQEAVLREEAAKAAEIGNAVAAARLEAKSRQVVVKAEESGRGSFTGAKTVVTKRWDFEVTDIVALATAYPGLVMANSALINEAIRGGDRNIPGLRIYQKEDLSVRA